MDNYYNILFHRWIDEELVLPDPFKQERRAMLMVRPVARSVMDNEFIMEQVMFGGEKQEAKHGG